MHDEAEFDQAALEAIALALTYGFHLNFYYPFNGRQDPAAPRKRQFTPLQPSRVEAQPERRQPNLLAKLGYDGEWGEASE